MPDITLYHGDNRLTLAAMPENSIDAVFTDPPYNYQDLTNRFGKKNAARAVEGKDGLFRRMSDRWRGSVWDATGIERDPEFWRIVLRVMKPGAYAFAFSSPKTGHRQASAMEDAGFIMHPMFIWAYAQGMPKAHSVAAAGEEWEGWYQSTQTQKPALEPIYLAQKPFSEKTGVANVIKHGVGAFNVDGCRVGNRWPSNLILDGSPEVIAAFPGDNERCFHQFPPDANPIAYHPKAGKADRAGSEHPSVKPIGLIQNLIRHITPPGGTVLDPFAGSGTTAEAAIREGMDCILMEAEPEYAGFIAERFDIPTPARRLFKSSGR